MSWTSPPSVGDLWSAVPQPLTPRAVVGPQGRHGILLNLGPHVLLPQGLSHAPGAPALLASSLLSLCCGLTRVSPDSSAEVPAPRDCIWTWGL